MARHRVPRYELVGLLGFFRDRESGANLMYSLTANVCNINLCFWGRRLPETTYFQVGVGGQNTYLCIPWREKG